jgi:uncharacterized protein
VSRGVWVGAAGVAALAWFSSAELNLVMRLWLIMIIAGLPPLMITQARQLVRIGPLPRTPAYVSSIVSLWLLAGITAALAFGSGYSGAALGLGRVAPVQLLGWTTVLLVAGLGTIFAFHHLGFRESSVTRELVPASPAERRWFIGVSISAGVCEEVIFRGFLVLALHAATGSILLAVLLSSTAFGLVHAYQQPVGALRAGLLGALLAAPLVVHSTLWPAIIAHTLLDLVAGLYFARYLTR